MFVAVCLFFCRGFALNDMRRFRHVLIYAQQHISVC